MNKYLSLFKTAVLLPEKVSHLPCHIQFDATTSCNLNCKMCYAKKVVNDAEQFKSLSFDRFRSIFDPIKPLSVNLAASGEPFLNHEIFKIIAHGKANNSQVIVSTNFTEPASGKVEAIVNSGIDVLKISVDGATKSVYEGVRGPHFSALTANLEALKKAVSNSKNPDFSARIDFVIIKTNISDISNIVEFAHSYNIRHIFYRICDPRGWPQKDKDELLKDSFDAIYAELKAAEKLAAKYGVTTNLKELFSNLDIWRFIYQDALPEGRDVILNKPVCLLPWLQLFVSVLGDTSFCCSIYPSRDSNMGNVFKDDIKDIWNNPQWQRARKLFKERKNYEIFEGCQYCIPMTRTYLFNLLSLFPGYVHKLLRNKP